MHYEKVADAHNFNLTPEEARAVKAAYTELSVLLEKKGNPESVSNHQRSNILHEAQEITNVVYDNPVDFAEILEDFAERTDEEAQEIANLPLPDHANTYVAERRLLGETAAALAAEVRQAIGPARSLAEDEDSVLWDIEQLPGTKE